MTKIHFSFSKNETTQGIVPNHWDVMAVLLILVLLFGLGYGASDMLGRFQIDHIAQISLSPHWLPYYALRSVIRMFMALFCSLVFTIIVGAWAAKSRRAERLIIPMIDVLQSVPVLGFLSITVVGFIALFPGRILGPECAAIFAIFTAQVWNMTLSFYQSVQTVPAEWGEAARMLRLSPWQRFWHLDVPFSMPALVWNMMMSMSGSWVFLVASEAISVAHQDIMLPGVGSYIALAIQQADKAGIVYAIITMFIVVGLYDLLFFRPLMAWAQKFKPEDTPSEDYAESAVLTLFQRTAWLKKVMTLWVPLFEVFVNGVWINRLWSRRGVVETKRAVWRGYVADVIVWVALVAAAVWLCWYILSAVSWPQVRLVVWLGFLTMLRVAVVLVLITLVWVPLGIWIGQSNRLTSIVQPIAQFFAAFPANLLFPVVAWGLVYFHLNINIWSVLLMALGTQWYVLFNVLAGVGSLPRHLNQAVTTVNVTGWLRWRRFILPGIFPYYITGLMTAAGGAWNISIIAEVISWGHQHFQARGLGAYVALVSEQGDFTHLSLGIVVMSLYVVVVNRLVWLPLYRVAQERFRIE